MKYKTPIILSAAIGCALGLPAYAYNTAPNYALPSTQQQNWNNIFTQQLRNSKPTLWGNWSLSPDIKPGDIGTIDPATGTFTRRKNPISPDIQNSPSESSWLTSSTDVTKTKGNIDLHGDFKDPNTGVPIHAGVKFNWNFAKNFTFMSQFALKEESSLSDLQSYIQKNWNALDETAKYYHYGDGKGGITQGFGIVTKVLYAYSGFNVGANSSNAQFSLAGTLEGLQAMTGEGSQGGGIGGKGFFSYSNQKGNLDVHLWPGKGSTLADPEHPIPIAYEFASFNGKEVIPTWIRDMSTFKVHINNSAGSTYIAKADLAYSIPGHDQTVHEKATITGGLDHNFNNIPLNATNVNLDISFIKGGEGSPCHYHWQQPLAKWLGGEQYIEVHGIWSGAVQCYDHGSSPKLKQAKRPDEKIVL